MNSDSPEPLLPEAELALAWSPPKVRGPLTTAFQLDRRLGRIVGRTTEPMLGQMRLAWWRDALGQPVDQRPTGDMVLDGVGDHWAGREAAMVALVDAWEVLITSEALDHAAIERFATLRSRFFATIADSTDAVAAARVAAAGFRWALADAAAAVSDAGERARLIEAGRAVGKITGRIPTHLRGLAVLDALSLRALSRGGRPLMEGRGASIAALRAAIFLT